MSSMNVKPLATDDHPTPTSRTQAETEADLLEYRPLNGEPPTLDKRPHVRFLSRHLTQGLSVRYMTQDASQPWMMFWMTQSFSALQVAFDAEIKQRIIDKTLAWQHPDGGFAGCPGHFPHLLPTYASICTLAIVGRPGPRGGWDEINREGMYKFFMSLKQPDGSFLVARHAEVDVRGIYCLLLTATLLNILTPELVENTAEFISSCQTYEGGFSSASHPSYSLSGTLLPTPRPCLGEAHGGYTYCAIASWILLQPYLESVDPELRPKLDSQNLLRWLVHMQGVDIELGGFKGRTNKLVDGCYSWWCGGSFPLLEALGIMGGPQNATELGVDAGGGSEKESEWADADEGLFNNHALQEYILYAGQHPDGGLRDKPPKNADLYHTHYCLSGLSLAQHHMFSSNSRREEIADKWEASDIPTDDLRKRAFSSIMSWIEEEGGSYFLGGPANRLNATHPLTNLTVTHTEATASYFYKQQVPPRKKK